MKIIFESIVNALKLPKDVMLNHSQIIIQGKGELIIVNYKSVIEFNDTQIKINAKLGFVEVVGKNLILTELKKDHLRITGVITNVNME